MKTLDSVIQSSRASLCYECGKCTSHCPIARTQSGYSPRSTMSSVVQGRSENLVADEGLWHCLTCGLCEAYCPSEILYTAFTQQFRVAAREAGCSGWCSHGGALQSMMKMMGASDIRQNRLDWVTDDLETATAGDTIYFVGCLPHFDAFFEDIEADSLNIARSTIRVLNAIDIVPVLMEDERCCGHDLLWEGDEPGFELLARRNLEAIAATGAKRVIASCAECARTLKIDYERFGGAGVEVAHLSEVVAEKVATGELILNGPDRVVTYQDPCRLGRHLGVYDAPRTVMNGIAGTDLHEMRENRKNAVCCGTSAWTDCNVDSMQIQKRRLESARQTGADVLVTTCPKCAIHYKCVQAGTDYDSESAIEIRDLQELVAESL